MPMRIMKKMLLLGGVLLLLLCGTAEAKAPPEGWGNAYMKAALEYWGVDGAPNCASTEIVFNSSLPSEYTSLQDQLEGVSLTGLATIAMEPGTSCVMFLGSPAERGVFVRCALFAHEYGHWLGHTDNPDAPWWSVEATLVTSITHDRPCQQLVDRTKAS